MIAFMFSEISLRTCLESIQCIQVLHGSLIIFHLYFKRYLILIRNVADMEINKIIAKIYAFNLYSKILQI